MDKKNSISLAAYEFTFERISHHIRRLIAIIIGLIIALIATNVAWVIFQARWNVEVHPTQYVIESQAEDGDGGN